MKYRIIRSNRKTLGISISKECEVIIRAPKNLSEKIIEKEIEKASSWIEKAIIKQKQRRLSLMNSEFDADVIRKMKEDWNVAVKAILREKQKRENL